MAEGEVAVAEIIVVPQTFLEKLLFYTTAFFILLGTFSLFAFLFLVPFVIDPAFTTIFMQFDPVAALCVTVDTANFRGASNCSWASCREGCTREVYDCTQIRVNYKILDRPTSPAVADAGDGDVGEEEDDDEDLMLRRRRRSLPPSPVPPRARARRARWVRRTRRAASRRDEDWWPPRHRWGDRHDHQPLAPRPGPGLASQDVDYPIAALDADLPEEAVVGANELDDLLESPSPTGLMGNDSEWFFIGARLFPNVKGCGYPPMLNCSVFLKRYRELGTNFSCYYSKIDPGLVISDLDMRQVYMNLVYALAIPIPSFIISVIYLTVAYFKIYAEDDDGQATGVENTPLPGASPLPNGGSGGLTPVSDVFRDDMASFGHQLKVAMVDEMSRDSVQDACIVTSNSTGNCVGTPHGNLSKTMTTSITTPPGPIAEL